MAFTGPFEDRIAIRELFETYAAAVTALDADVWGGTWAEDAEWSLPDYPEIGTTHGRTAIVAMWIEAMKGFPGIMFEAWPGAIAVTGDTATAICYTSEVYDRDGQTHRDRGRYEDTLIKQEGRWFFQTRAFRNIHRQVQPKGI